jgi:hypothetical protein
LGFLANLLQTKRFIAGGIDMKCRMFLVLFLAALFAVAGCGEMKGNNPFENRDELPTRVEKYNEFFQWHQEDVGQLMVLPSQRGQYNIYVKELGEGYSLDEFFIVDIEISPSGEKAAVVVQRKFVKSSSVTLETEQVTQEWVKKDGDWYLAGPPF